MMSISVAHVVARSSCDLRSNVNDDEDEGGDNIENIPSFVEDFCIDIGTCSWSSIWQRSKSLHLNPVQIDFITSSYLVAGVTQLWLKALLASLLVIRKQSSAIHQLIKCPCQKAKHSRPRLQDYASTQGYAPIIDSDKFNNSICLTCSHYSKNIKILETRWRLKL